MKRECAKGIRDSPDCAYFAHYEGNKVSNNVSNYGEGRESLDSGKVQVLKKDEPNPHL